MKYTSAFNRPAASFDKSYDALNKNWHVRDWGRDNPYWMNETTGCKAIRIKYDGSDVSELWTSTDGELFNLAYGPCPACEEEIRSQCTCSDDKRAGRARVIFRVYEGEVIAVLPEHDSGAWGSVLVYANSWVAGMSPRAVMTQTRRAAPSEIEASGLIPVLENDFGSIRRITYAQLLSDDCNGGIGPSDYANDLWDVGCNWAEGFGYRGMHTTAACELQVTARREHMHKMKNYQAYSDRILSR